MKHYITLLVDTDRDPAHIAELIAHRAYEMDGVEDCEVLKGGDWTFNKLPPFRVTAKQIGGLDELEAREPIV